MADRPRFFDDLAGVAGGAFSALTGLREEVESMARARIDELIRALDLVKRDELDAVQEMAANARAGQEAAEARLAALEARLATLESAAVVATPEPGRADTSDNGAEAAPPSVLPAMDAPGSAAAPTEPA